MRRIALLVSLIVLVLTGRDGYCQVEEWRAESEKKWKSEINNFLNPERQKTDYLHSEEKVIFYGSSSIRKWVDISTDMLPFKVIQYGFGGATYFDGAVFADTLLSNLKVKAMVLFFANDISNSNNNHKPTDVRYAIEIIIKSFRKSNPSAPVIIVSVTPSEKRFYLWKDIQALNAEIQNFCQNTENVYFLQTDDFYLTEAGKPNPDLFEKDKLHQNRFGYRVWSSLIKAKLFSLIL